MAFEPNLPLPAPAPSGAARRAVLGRPATAEEVSNVICFIASEEARMMNGSIVTVDGGAAVVDLPTLAFVEPVQAGARG